MNQNLEKLISLGGPALSMSKVALDQSLLGHDSSLIRDLSQLLVQRNGFFAFESALHVFPSDSGYAAGIEKWNCADLWRSTYGTLADGCLFFAEDAFGGQFCIKGRAVCSFDPETGDLHSIAGSLDGWAAAILSDYEVMTGYPVAHAWQEKYGPIPSDKRLVPKIPFVLGGSYELDNLHLLESTRGMRLRAELAMQLRDLPDGSTVKFRTD